MKDLKLDILNRADDDIIDSLVPFSSDDKKTKKRILAMSEKKLAELQRGSESETNEISVRGVEQYRRPVWYRPLCAAAAFVVMAGGIGMFALLNRTKGNQFDDPDKNNAAATTEADTTETNTEADTTEVQTTEAATEAQTEINGHTFEEMKGIADELLPHWIEARNLCSKPNIDTSGEQLKIWSSYFEEDLIYYKINNPHFTSYDELISYYSPYFIDPVSQFYCFRIEGDDTSVLENDENIHGMIEYKGELYAHEYFTPTVPDYAAITPISEKPSQIRENSFGWERATICQPGDEYLGGGSEDWVAILDMEFMKDDDGVWKIASCQPSSGALEDFNAEFGNSIENEISAKTNTDYDTVYDTVREYLKNEYDYTGIVTINLADQLYDNVEIINDNYVNNNNWISCTCSSLLHDGSLLTIFIDENGTIFAKNMTH